MEQRIVQRIPACLNATGRMGVARVQDSATVEFGVGLIGLPAITITNLRIPTRMIRIQLRSTYVIELGVFNE